MRNTRKIFFSYRKNALCEIKFIVYLNYKTSHVQHFNRFRSENRFKNEKHVKQNLALIVWRKSFFLEICNFCRKFLDGPPDIDSADVLLDCQIKAKWIRKAEKHGVARICKKYRIVKETVYINKVTKRKIKRESQGRCHKRRFVLFAL